MKRALMVTAGTAAGLRGAELHPTDGAAGRVGGGDHPGSGRIRGTSRHEPGHVAACGRIHDQPAVVLTHRHPAAPSGTFTGSTVGTRYGDVQVAVTLAAGKLTAVTALAFPSADTKSAAVSDQAIPLLREETIAAQSAEVATISGATYTSKAWQESLAAALAQAGL